MQEPVQEPIQEPQLKKKKKEKKKKANDDDGGDDNGDGGNDEGDNGDGGNGGDSGRDGGNKDDVNNQNNEDTSDRNNDDAELDKAIVVYTGGEGSSGTHYKTSEDDLMFDIKKELEGGLENAEVFFSDLFNDQTPVNKAETHTDESDPELAELFEDIDDEVNLPDKPVYVTA
ncbi:hypothetical protein L1987_16186 [Smallanthus sonchifolius]|uniref:Uncharacterized protein n=1 Tax=Smallanthus sonchifolius TaxID=185202 RepID=A0ACB9J7N6_9ASTR|nr:hypothetical protein L1987_16186 [Smallanthus sonchifolius]